jgi:hypothetical protein
MAYKDICLFASHYGTVGAGREGIYEEPLFKQLVPRAVQILNDQGFNTVYTGGLTGHEIDQHREKPNEYDVTISNHFNVGKAFVIYNPSHNNPNAGTFINEVTARLLANGIDCTGAYSSDQYAMCNYGKSDNYLIEWADCQKSNELHWIADVEARAWDLADFTRKVFLDGNNASGNGGNYNPNPPVETPAGDTPEQTDGYGLVAEYNAPKGRITSQDADRIIGFNDVLRTSDSGVGLYQGEYFESTDTEYLVRLQGDDNYIMRQSATSGLFFAVGTWLYDTYGQRVVDELYNVTFSI